MKKMMYAALTMLLSTMSFAATVTGTGTATATILTPVTVVNKTNLAFASIIPGASAGTVVVAQATGTATYSVAQFGGGTTAAGVVTLNGPTTQAITSVTIADGTINGTPSGSMTVTSFQTSCQSGCTLAAGTLDVRFGATLNVGANQTAGAYTGNVTVTVTY